MTTQLLALALAQTLSPSTPGDLDPLNGAVVQGELAYLLRTPEHVSDRVTGFVWKKNVLIFAVASDDGVTVRTWGAAKDGALASFKPGIPVELRQSPSGETVAILARQGDQVELTYLGDQTWKKNHVAKGLSVAVTDAGLGVASAEATYGWLPNGKEVATPSDISTFEEGRELAYRTPAGARYGLVNGKWTAVPAAQAFEVAPIWVRLDDAKSGLESRPTWRTEAWMTSRGDEYPSIATIHTGVRGASLSPDLSKLAYDVNETLFVRRLHRMPKNQFLDLASAAEARVLLSQAKQVGTAMLIYGADCDDGFPLRNGWQTALEPYAKNRGLFDGFEYTLNGKYKNAADIENPADEELGRVRGRYGTAIVRADSSAIWRKHKP